MSPRARFTLLALVADLVVMVAAWPLPVDRFLLVVLGVLACGWACGEATAHGLADRREQPPSV